MTSHERHRQTASAARPTTVRLYVLGAIALGVTALVGGGNLLLDPTGASMDLPLAWLAGTPFSDYLVPGLVLFGLFGLGSFVVAYGLVMRTDWALVAAVGLGVALVGWIGTQIALIGVVHVLHFVYGGLGLALVALALAPATRTHLER